MNPKGAGAQTESRQLAQLLRIVDVRIAAHWRELGVARAAEAQCLRELEEQRARLERAQAKVVACQESIAQVRRGVFSPYDVRGHAAAQDRLAKLRDKESQAVQAAEQKYRAACEHRARIEAAWRRLRARQDTLAQMHRAARKGAAIHLEMLSDVMQDEEFAAMHAQPPAPAGGKPGRRRAPTRGARAGAGAGARDVQP